MAVCSATRVWHSACASANDIRGDENFKIPTVTSAAVPGHHDFQIVTSKTPGAVGSASAAALGSWNGPLNLNGAVIILLPRRRSKCSPGFFGKWLGGEIRYGFRRSDSVESVARARD